MMIDSILDLTRRINEIEGANVSVSIALHFAAPRCFRLSEGIMGELGRDFTVDHQVAPEPLRAEARHPDWHQHTVTLGVRRG